MSSPNPGSPYTNAFLQSLFPSQEALIPWNAQTPDHWVIEDNPLFNTQWVECSYPISGSYGLMPRYLFYFLALFAILKRRSAWIVTAALGSVMTYSATAAIHAIVLVALRTRLIPNWVPNEHMFVLVNGTSASGFNDTTGDSALWLPIIPMAWDNDADPVLSIVGTAFLALLPMQLWSTTFKRSEAKTVLFLWSGLLFIGTVSALINSAYVDLWAWPQLRFCPPGFNDTFPFTNPGQKSFTSPTGHVDGYYWNRTVYNLFENLTSQPYGACVYPCFTSLWPLRDSTEITVVSANTGTVAAGNTGLWLMIAVYAVVSSSCLSSLTVFAVDVSQQPPKTFISWWRVQQDRLLKPFKPTCVLWKRNIYRPMLSAWQWCFSYIVITKPLLQSEGWRNSVHHNIQRQRKYIVIARHFYLKVVSLYARLVSPVALLFFVVWSEWYMWTSDPPGESFRHVGQWGALVAAVIVAVAASVGRTISGTAGSKNPNPPVVV